MAPRSLRLKLHIKISILFAVLMLVVSSILIITSYLHLTGVIDNANQVVFDRTINDTAASLENDFKKISSEMKMLLQTPLVDESSLEEKLKILSILKVVVDENENVDAVYVGYNNGDIFLLRKIVDSASYSKQNLPKNTEYMLTVTLEKDGRRTATQTFYNKKFEIIQRLESDSYKLDATTRPWYKNTMGSEVVEISSPYVFYTNKKPGITLSIRNTRNNNVVGVDYTIDSLLDMVKKYSFSDETRTILFNSKGEILAANIDDKVVNKDGSKDKIATVDSIVDPVINDFAKKMDSGEDVAYDSGNKRWQGKEKKFKLQEMGEVFTVMTVTPVKTLMVKAFEYKKSLIFAGIVVVIVILPFVWVISVMIARPLTELSEQLNRINDFDFKSSINTKSSVVEIDNLINTSKTMINTIEKFRHIAESITKQRDYDKLLSIILSETTEISNGKGGAIYLFDKDEASLEIASVYLEGMDRVEQKKLLEEVVSFGSINKQLFEQHLDKDASFCFAGVDGVCVDEDILFWPSKINNGDLSLSVIDLQDSEQQLMGYIVFAHDKDIAFSHSEKGKMAFITALSGFVSSAIEGQILLEKRKELLQSLIVLVADAIDAKSPYTGKHCQRVPVITKMIIEKACEEKDGEYKDYNLTPDEWEEVRVASWLHDCGKVVTPVDVVDKATKLECIYNRIHEVRIRFELLKSYADRDYWKGLYEGGDKDKLISQRDAIKDELDDEFAFVAKCNIGGEFLTDEAVERLIKIGSRRWLRTIDNTQGLADIELKRYLETSAETKLPVEECLLDNKKEHVISKTKIDYKDNNLWGFTMEEPEYLFNRGELYNLEIKRGTLTDEERYIINAHMVHTIKMLSTLPFPKNMKNIVEIAGSHHEKMEGGGYPRAIKAKDLPLSARAMAIADVFEALTASDRPYKKIKTLSETLTIMKKMADGEHLDKQLFKLFVRSGSPVEYARKYLLKEQLDIVNIEEFQV